MRDLANRSEGLGAGLGWALSIKVRGWGSGWPRALSIKVKAWGAGPVQGPVDRSEGLGGRASPGPKHCEPPRWFAALLIARCHVQEAWRQIDEEALDKCSPDKMLALAQDVVYTLGRWPVVLSSCNCPQERRLEVRLALIFNAYVAKPYSTHPRMKFFEVIACKTKLRALREITMSATSAAQPGLSDIALWIRILRRLALHIRPVDGRDVFFHAPAKSMLQECAQEAVLRKCGAYQPLELCYQASKPWGRFFIFDKDFVAYNRAGMRAEDPSAHKWSASKLWIDYTPHVSTQDWTRALLDRLLLDECNIHALLRDRKRRQASSRSTCDCGRALGLRDVCECQSNDIQCHIVHDDILNVGDDSTTWHGKHHIYDWYVGEHGPDAATSALRDVRAALAGSWLKRRLQFSNAVVVERDHRSDPSMWIFNWKVLEPEPTKYSKYLLHDNAHCFYALDFGGHGPVPLLLWCGGTYARRPEDFPPEQSSAAWLEEHLLPLNLQPPSFRRHDSLEKLAKTWSLAKWHGKSPHPYAIKQPFPYATASMRSYCWDDYYVDAKHVPRESPWSSFHR